MFHFFPTTLVFFFFFSVGDQLLYTEVKPNQPNQMYALQVQGSTLIIGQG